MYRKRCRHTQNTLFFRYSSSNTHIKHHKKIETNPQNIPLDLSQNPLLDKLNTFFKKAGRKNEDGSIYQISTRGYCHGLTLLFLEKMTEGKIQWFYDTKRKIIECDDNNLEDLELEIDKFLALIEWAQNSSKYSENNISYFNIDLILDTQPQKSFDDLYDFEKLKNFLTYKQGKGNMMCITNCYGDIQEHTVGIFTDGVYYHFFDANYKNGEAVKFRSSKELTHEVLNRLYTNFSEEIPDNCELEIKMVNRPAKVNDLTSGADSFFNKSTSIPNIIPQINVISSKI